MSKNTFTLCLLALLLLMTGTAVAASTALWVLVGR